jgi:type VI secretion system protein ImpA
VSAAGSPPVLDIQALLRPIPGDNPGGVDPKSAGVHDALKRLRSRFEEGKSEWLPQPVDALLSEWIQTASDGLVHCGKDLQLAVWLVEALVKRHGFAGLRDGMRLVRELLTQFWPSLYPALEQGLDMRAGRIEFLDCAVVRAVLTAPMTDSPDGDAFTWDDWHRSRAEDARVSAWRFGYAVGRTPMRFYETLAADLAQCRREWHELHAAVASFFPDDDPDSRTHLSNLYCAVDECQILCRKILDEKANGLGTG